MRMKQCITSVIEQYLTQAAQDPENRYHSWDFCRKSFSAEHPNELHSLQLGFYLASWGMYRGSGGLLQKNHTIHQGIVDLFYSAEFANLKCTDDKEIFVSDIPEILMLRNRVASHYSSILFKRADNLVKGISPTDTLLSKVILGIYGCVPAYDEFLINGLKHIGIEQRKFNEAGLKAIFDFYEQHKQEIDNCKQAIQEARNICYPVMKIIDMYLWQVGYDLYLETLKTKKIRTQKLT
jgi:hypothetical protein